MWGTVHSWDLDLEEPSQQVEVDADTEEERVSIHDQWFLSNEDLLAIQERDINSKAKKTACEEVMKKAVPYAVLRLIERGAKNWQDQVYTERTRSQRRAAQKQTE
jgi:hypothetical protein